MRFYLQYSPSTHSMETYNTVYVQYHNSYPSPTRDKFTLNRKQNVIFYGPVSEKKDLSRILPCNVHELKHNVARNVHVNYI